MHVRLGELFAECPYCGGRNFVAPEAGGEEPGELACEGCGGYASRDVILERLAERVGELGALTLERLKAERRVKRRRR